MDALQRATINVRARDAADSLQLLNRMLTDAGYTKETHDVHCLLVAQAVARKISDGHDPS